jgi:hypothetical protein
MRTDVLDVTSGLALGMPFLVIALLLVHYSIRHTISKRKSREGPNRRFGPSSAALGAVFLFAQVFYRPSVAHVIEVRLEEKVEQDDQGDPEEPAKAISRQLRQIRQGQHVERLKVQL